jgi:NADH dehydrogenase
LFSFWRKAPKKPIRVLIVGAGLAGLSAARALEGQTDVHITILDKHSYHLFRPLLCQVATGALNPSEISSPIRSLFRRSSRSTVIQGYMTAIDRVRQTVEVNGGSQTLHYDYLILAMGGRTSYMGHPEWETHAPGLNNLEDATNLRDRILTALDGSQLESNPDLRRQRITVAVLGGGPTGVELAGALAELRRPGQPRVLLLEAGPRLLPAFPERASEMARLELERLGVEVLLGETVQEISQGLVKTRRRTLQAENIVWAAGVQGHPLATRIGCTLDRSCRVPITPELHLQGQPHVYCLGDMAWLADRNGQPLPGVASLAIQQGRHAAANIARHLDGQPLTPFRYCNKGPMVTIGRKSALAVLPDGIILSGRAAWLAWLALQLAFIVDLQNRITVILRWGRVYLGWKWNVSLITDSNSKRRLEGGPNQAGNPEQPLYCRTHHHL